MTSTPERLALLRAAYTRHHLPLRGVQTLGGWFCTQVDVANSVWVHELRSGARYLATVLMKTSSEVTSIFGPTGLAGVRHGSDGSLAPMGEWEGELDDPRKALLDGDLLPDLSDPLTFHLALRELAEADGVPNRPHSPNIGFGWTQGSADQRAERSDERGECPPFWTLVVMDPNGWTSRHYFHIDTDDPIDALLQTRIQVHEESKK
jgi:hypothetical protein